MSNSGRTISPETLYNSKQKIVIYRGLFDPLHNGHKAIIGELYNKFDKIYIVPAKNKWNMMFSDNARLSFIMDYVTKCYPALNKIHIINDELEDKTNELSKIFNLINHINNKYLNKIGYDIYLCIGWDEYKNLNKCDFYEELLKKFKLVVINRDNSKFENLYPDLNKDVINMEIHGCEDLSSTKIRKTIYNYVILN